ncbi:hypothetical protein RclHR1_21790002 [Rhizophagus clarus]|uniref:Uncharacterized protein n=1 Tax=Rhizophagus clarus TaxID=94130 RepID=A0A2Z6RM92_9GLOM|nr:hypothetical protein RclHR1_21790002 [Rhizophagus clarus]
MRAEGLEFRDLQELIPLCLSGRSTCEKYKACGVLEVQPTFHKKLSRKITQTSKMTDITLNCSYRPGGDFNNVQCNAPCADLVLGLPWLYLRKAKIDIQKERIKIYGDFVPFCKGPDNSDSEADSSESSLAEEAYTIEELRESDSDNIPSIIKIPQKI